MHKYLLVLIFSVTALSACKKKKKTEEPERKYFSALSLIRSQVAHVDTSLYRILRIEIKDSLHSDTSFMKREEFRDAAKDFLDMPDMADKTFASRYKEETLFDETINRVMISYTPVDPAAEEIKKVELLATPDQAGATISDIIITRVINNRDNYIQKNMLWLIDKSFQVTTIRRLPGGDETTTTLKVIWNEDEDRYR